MTDVSPKEQHVSGVQSTEDRSNVFAEKIPELDSDAFPSLGGGVSISKPEMKGWGMKRDKLAATVHAAAEMEDSTASSCCASDAQETEASEPIIPEFSLENDAFPSLPSGPHPKTVSKKSSTPAMTSTCTPREESKEDSLSVAVEHVSEEPAKVLPEFSLVEDAFPSLCSGKPLKAAGKAQASCWGSNLKSAVKTSPTVATSMPVATRKPQVADKPVKTSIPVATSLPVAIRKPQVENSLSQADHKPDSGTSVERETEVPKPEAPTFTLKNEAFPSLPSGPRPKTVIKKSPTTTCTPREESIPKEDSLNAAVEHASEEPAKVMPEFSLVDDAFPSLCSEKSSSRGKKDSMAQLSCWKSNHKSIVAQPLTPTAPTPKSNVDAPCVNQIPPEAEATVSSPSSVQDEVTDKVACETVPVDFSLAQEEFPSLGGKMSISRNTSNAWKIASVLRSDSSLRKVSIQASDRRAGVETEVDESSDPAFSLAKAEQQKTHSDEENINVACEVMQLACEEVHSECAFSPTSDDQTNFRESAISEEVVERQGKIVAATGKQELDSTTLDGNLEVLAVWKNIENLSPSRARKTSDDVEGLATPATVTSALRANERSPDSDNESSANISTDGSGASSAPQETLEESKNDHAPTARNLPVFLDESLASPPLSRDVSSKSCDANESIDFTAAAPSLSISELLAYSTISQPIPDNLWRTSADFEARVRKTRPRGGQSRMLHPGTISKSSSMGFTRDTKVRPLASLRSTSSGWLVNQGQLMPHGASNKDDAAVAKKIRGILNKLNDVNFDTLIVQLMDLGINTKFRINVLCAEVFEKATTQHGFIDVYTKLCKYLASENLVTSDGTDFRRELLETCKQHFEKHLTPPQGMLNNKVDDVDAFERELKYKCALLGNVKFIGALLCQKLIASKVMLRIGHELLEENSAVSIESLCVLLTTCGSTFDCPSWSGFFVFDAILTKLSMSAQNRHLGRRVEFLIKDVEELRKKKWC